MAVENTTTDRDASNDHYSDGARASASSWPLRRLKQKQAASNYASLLARMSAAGSFHKKMTDENDALRARLEVLERIFIFIDWIKLDNIASRIHAQSGSHETHQPEVELSPAPKSPPGLFAGFANGTMDAPLLPLYATINAAAECERVHDPVFFDIFDTKHDCTTQTTECLEQKQQQHQTNLSDQMSRGTDDIKWKGKEDDKEHEHEQHHADEGEEDGKTCDSDPPSWVMAFEKKLDKKNDDIKWKGKEDDKEHEHEQHHADEGEEDGKTCDSDLPSWAMVFEKKLDKKT